MGWIMLTVIVVAVATAGTIFEKKAKASRQREKQERKFAKELYSGNFGEALSILPRLGRKLTEKEREVLSSHVKKMNRYGAFCLHKKCGDPVFEVNLAELRSSLLGNLDIDEAREVAEAMGQPITPTEKRNCVEKALQKGVYYLRKVEEAGFPIADDVWQRLRRTLVERGEYEALLDLKPPVTFDELRAIRPNIKSWKTLVRAARQMQEVLTRDERRRALELALTYYDRGTIDQIIASATTDDERKELRELAFAARIKGGGYDFEFLCQCCHDFRIERKVTQRELQPCREAAIRAGDDRTAHRVAQLQDIPLTQGEAMAIVLARITNGETRSAIEVLLKSGVLGCAIYQKPI